MSATYITPESATSQLIHHTTGSIIETNAENAPRNANWWKRFVKFSITQEKNRFGWLAVAITLQACVLAPLTLLTLMLTSSPFFLWFPCILAFALTEVINLAAMPTRITIPIFFAGIVTDILVVLACFILL